MITIKEEFLDSPKWRRAIELGGCEAIVMWLALKGYAATNPTDGFIPDDDIERLPGAPRNPRKALKALVECGRTNRDGSRAAGLVDAVSHGWQLHDYLEHAEHCRYCGTEVVPGEAHRFGRTIDHVVPRCQGGTSDASNLVVACRGCNSRKGGRTPEQAGMRLQ